VADQRFLGIQVQLRTEAAADFRRDDAELVFRYADHAGQQRADEMRNLGGSPECDSAFAAMVGGYAPPRLDGHGSEALMNHAQLDDAVGFLEFLVDVAGGEGPVEGDVGSEFRVSERRVLFERFLGFADNRQRVVIDFDEVQGIARDVTILRDDDRYGMADEVNAIRREDGVVWRFLFRHRRRTRNNAAMLIHVGSGENRYHTRQRFGRIRINAVDLRVGERAAQD
jgi:hypothetical protein